MYKELYFFQSRTTQDRNNHFVWYRCQTEDSCKKMAEGGYNVKKVVYNIPDTEIEGF